MQMTNAMNDSRIPKVSIIIPAYNTANLIASCLDSVLSQTYSDFEVLVVNDGSPDTPELEKVLAPYMDRVVYIKQENKRAAGARNTAIRQARGEFLAFLDSDDTWLPHHLAAQMKRFTEDSSLDFVYGNGIRIADPRRQVEFMDVCPSHGTANFEALVVERCHISISTVVVRKSAIVKAGGFDEGLRMCDDYDMWLRTAFHGAKMGYGREVQARLNGGRPGSLSESRVKMLEAYLGILEKAIRTLPLNEAQHKLVSTRISELKARALVQQGKDQLREGRFDKARELFSEANRLHPEWKVSLTLRGLSIAPQATSRLLFAWSWVSDGFSA
jgi:glycosyltransferase involved in cell wall biosynthesis